MFTQNLVIVTGFVGQNPRITTFEDGNKSAMLNIATSRKYTNKSTGEMVETTDWHSVVITGKKALNIEKYVKKGTLLSVEGRLQTRKYSDKEGVVRYSTEIFANRIQFHNKKEDDGSEE